MNESRRKHHFENEDAVVHYTLVGIGETDGSGVKFAFYRPEGNGWERRDRGVHFVRGDNVKAIGADVALTSGVFVAFAVTKRPSESSGRHITSNNLNTNPLFWPRCLAGSLVLDKSTCKVLCGRTMSPEYVSGFARGS